MNRKISPPAPQPVTVLESIHGIEVEDKFRWLEDQASSSTRDFIKTEQDFYQSYLEQKDSVRSQIASRVRDLVSSTSIDLPVSDRRGGLIYGKCNAGEEQKSLYQRDSHDREERIPSCDAAGRDRYTSPSVLQVSPDGRYLAFALRFAGEDSQEIGIYDLFDHRLLMDRLPRGVLRGLVFDRTGSGYFYAIEEHQARQSDQSVRYHAFGTDQTNDEQVFNCGSDPSIRLRLLDAEDGSGLGYAISSLPSGSQMRFLIHRFPLGLDPEEIPLPGNAWISPRFSRSGIIASTTLEAPLGRIVFIRYEDPEPRNWLEIVSQSQHRLHGFELTEENIITHYSEGPRMTTSVFSIDGRLSRQISYPEDGTVTLGRVDCCQNRLFFGFSDIFTNFAIYAVDLDSGETREWWRSVDPKWRVTPRVDHRWYPGPDGHRIPLTIVQSTRVKSPSPTILTAYGSPGAYDTPKFSTVLTILVESGFNYVIAHLGAVNESSNRRQREQFSIDGLIAAAQWLIDNQFANPGHLGLAGQSHGALLALCAMTQRPELFRAIVALGPLADLTRFHLFGVARWFTQELGSPDDPDDFQVLYSLSPYHRVRPNTQYPAVLIISGDLDQRCDAMHARKMVAALRESNSKLPILLDYSEHRGHKPGLPVGERVRSLTDRLTFLIAELTDQRSTGVDPCKDSC